MPTRRIFAVVCAALALTFASGSAALAYSTDSAKPPSTTDDQCAAGDHVIRGSNGADTIDANKAPYNASIPYTICTFGGDDTIIANNAGDHIIAGPGNDTIYGGTGNDTVEGQGGTDTIFGGGGQDVLLGQTGDDFIYANDKDNTDDGFVDTIDGGTGNDHCVFTTTGANADKASNCP